MQVSKTRGERFENLSDLPGEGKYAQEGLGSRQTDVESPTLGGKIEIPARLGLSIENKFDRIVTKSTP